MVEFSEMEAEPSEAEDFCPQRDQEQWLVSLKWVMPKDETISFAAKS